MKRPVTNQQLHALLAEAGYDRSHAALARQVNEAADAEYGLDLRYDGASVYWWLRGRCPEQPAPELIAAVLSRRTKRPVAVADLGFLRITSAQADGLTFPDSTASAIDTATSLWGRLSRSSTETADTPFVPAAAVEAGWRWHFDPPDRVLAHQGRGRVGADDIERLRSFQGQFLDLDRRHGGGHAHRFLADVLVRDVVPLLHGSYTDAVGRELFAVAAELTGTLAFMAYDHGSHGIAQRGFTQALRLAKVAGDRTFGAHVLANLATQAIYLQLPGEAVRLARAAVDGAGRHPSAAVAARLHNTEATACALAGDLVTFRTALRRSERAMDRSDGSGPAWASYFTPAHLAGTAMRCLLDFDRPGEALTYAGEALQLAPGNVRTRALHTALIATAHARAGDLDQAAALGLRAVGLARQIRSRRVHARLADLARQVTSHGPVPGIEPFLEAVHGLPVA
ncbi:hypothetical protein [Microtetraspora malaysiensis]|uniref:hypothetical protein n=1 Tax=Microtetraspora malaysiensis TaxID=161358 RepID=UPI003D918494